MRLSFKHVIAVGLAAAVVQGCSGVADGVIVNSPRGHYGFTVGTLEFAAQHGELKTEIRGVPFASPPQDFARRVTDMMQGANIGPSIVFTSNPTRIPPKGYESRYRVVVQFDPPKNYAAENACASTNDVDTGSSGSAVGMLAAFCYDNDLLSQSEGTTFGVNGIDDPKFRSLVRQVIFFLFPQPYIKGN